MNDTTATESLLLESRVEFSVHMTKKGQSRGRVDLLFEERGIMLTRNRLRVGFSISTKVCMSAALAPLPESVDLFGETSPKETASASLTLWLTSRAEKVLHVLNLIYYEAGRYFTNTTERRSYTREAWTRALRTLKKVFRATMTSDQIVELARAAYDEHLKGLATFEENQAKKKAPVPRQIANAARIEQAAKMGLPEIALDGLLIEPARVLEEVRELIAAQPITPGAVEEAIVSKNVNGRLALAAFSNMTGLEILCLFTLLQFIREKAGADRRGIQAKMTSFIVNREDFLARAGFDLATMSDDTRRRRLSEIRYAVDTMARRPVLVAPAKSEVKRKIAAYQSAFFVFKELEVKDEDFEAGAWRFSELDLLQVLEDDALPFRDVPVRPFQYIAQEADPRRYTHLMRLCADVLLHASFGAGETVVDLTAYDLDAGQGGRATDSTKDREILTHALERYGEGRVEIDRGTLTFTPSKRLED